jgi:NAD kinase/nicotinic acid mononucleotide adenylyltransferase
MDRSIALFGGSFNPPGEHHRAIAEHLSGFFDEVIVIPCGPRPDKGTTTDTPPIHRAAMADLNFRGLSKVRVELFDLEESTFTRTHKLDERFRGEGTVWHVVGADLVQGGRDGRSPIQREWEQGARIWQQCRFAVVTRPGFELDPADLPPQSRVFQVEFDAAGLQIRSRVFHHEAVDHLLRPEVADYIHRHGLYRGAPPTRSGRLRLDAVRPMVFMDQRNSAAAEVARQLDLKDQPDANLIIVIGGDGTMLRAIREHWRRRIPFYGINVGHLGFLLNDTRPAGFTGRELVLEQVPLLWAEVEDPDGVRRTALAFNDAWVERATGQTAWIEVKVNGQQRIAHLVADGVLVATAAGSASYARAMGAAPMPLNTPALLLVGSNVLKPYFWKPAVLPLDSQVECTTLDVEKRPLIGYIDGVCQGPVRTMRARVSNIAAVELAFEPEHDPATKLARIQFPPM